MLHPAHTSQACAHPDVVCPAQLGPHITRFKERTDEFSGKRAYSDLASGDWMRGTEVRRHGRPAWLNHRRAGLRHGSSSPLDALRWHPVLHLSMSSTMRGPFLCCIRLHWQGMGRQAAGAGGA